MLAHKLALRLGRTVRELGASMDAQEWASWQAFDRVCPVGDERPENMLATLTAVVINKLRGEGDDPVSAADMAPDHGGMRAELERMERRTPEWRKRKLAELRAGFLGG